MGEMLSGITPSDLDYRQAWTISTPVAGITCTALMVVSTTNAIPIVGVYVPSTANTVEVVIRRATMLQVTGTVVEFVWGVLPSPATMTAANGVGTARRNGTFANSGCAARYFAGSTAVVGVPLPYRYLGGGVAGAVSAGQNNTYMDFVDGEIVVQPGSFVGVFATAVGGIVLGSLDVVERKKASTS